MPTRNVNLTHHFDEFVERQVSSGRYSNASEIVREALRLLEAQEEERKAKLKALQQAAPLDAARIQYAYECLYGRPPTEHEVSLGLDFLRNRTLIDEKLTRWEQYAHLLLASNEMLYVD